VILEIDPASAVPPFEQMRAQIAGLVASGVLPAGTRLPAIRQLAGDLGLAPGTVARAYRELEQSGLVASKGRHGTRVTDLSERRAPVPRTAHLDEAAATFAAAASRAGSDLDQALDAVRRAFSRTTAQGAL
jgi:DNA-binding transcriptional regulator YhcF (GntR family)